MKSPHLPTLPRLLALVSLFVGAQLAHAADFHVSPAGNDRNPGTRSAPLQTLEAARNAARPFCGKERVTVHVADGIYYLPQTLVLAAEDSGSQQCPVVFRAENEGRAILSGGQALDLSWKESGNGIFQATTPPGLELDQLFVDGRRQRMARYPNHDETKPTAAYQGYAADAFAPERAARWSNPAGGFIHAMHKHRWGGYHYRITGKKPDGSISYEGGWQNNRQMGMHAQFRMVENILEELDAPGEWFHDAKSRTLHFKPAPGLDLPRARIEVVRLRHLVEFSGSSEKPVRFVSFDGFVFRHTARTFMDTREPLLRSDWTIYRGGAVLLTGTEDVSLLNSEFDQVGGNAIFVDGYARRILVRGCHIRDAGASGVAFVGRPSAVRNPLFEYGQRLAPADLDLTPGPKGPDYPSDCAVEDSLIHGIGRVERQAAAVQVSMSQCITIRDCSLYDCSRAGINFSEGTWGGHLIERCDVFDTVLETSDHGSFNSWGRDRYWPAPRPKPGVAPLARDPALPFLDATKTTVIRDSRWRCDHGWDIDLDDGSSNYDITNNLLLSGGLKLREGYRRRAWNNIVVNNSLHPHVWYPESGDEVTGNILMAAPRGVETPTDAARGKTVDRNFYHSGDPAAAGKFLHFGWDANSLVGDARFVDPASGDFRVREDSPALRLGFRNFPMDQFGVKKPSLKAIAKTPVIPALRFVVPASSSGGAITWLGATVRGIEGEEFSAFGTAREDGGVHLVKVPADSAAARLGLAQGDLIQSIDGRKIRTAAELPKHTAPAPVEGMRITLVRAQQEMTLGPAPLGQGPVPAPATKAVSTYCNPLPLPNYPLGRSARTVSNGDPSEGNALWLLGRKEQFRELADPSALWHEGKWYLYPSVDMAWVSEDMGGTWTHRPLNIRDVGYAPTVVKRGTQFLLLASDSELYEASSPLGPFASLGRMQVPKVSGMPGFTDPMLFADDNGRLYFYWGCTRAGGIWGVELDAGHPTRALSVPRELIPFDPQGQPWEALGEWNQDPTAGWVEGAWLLKRHGKYFLTFSAAGTQNRSYAMGCYVAQSPLGPFAPQKRNPIFRTTEGLVTGTAHGCIVAGPEDQVWTFYTVRAGVAHGFERRLGMDRAEFDANGELFVPTATSLPQWLPGKRPAYPGGGPTGWLPINGGQASLGSSSAPNLPGRLAVDNELRTWWQPAADDAQPVLTCRFSAPALIRAVRVVWRDVGMDSNRGVKPGPFRYRVELETAKDTWTTLLDRSESSEDFLVDYREVPPTTGLRARLVLLGWPQGITPGVAEFTVLGNTVVPSQAAQGK